MRASYLLDTGPLVAFLNRRERHHAWACEQLKACAAPLLTCEAVLTEAFFLLRAVPGGPERIFELLRRGLLQAPFQVSLAEAALSRLFAQYHDLPISLADACLVRMAETIPGSTVLTLDRDFSIYRLESKKPVPFLAPPHL